nr:MAG TPA: apocytochrome F [Caudoviricetes sp.]
MRDGAGGKGTGIASDCLPLGWGSLYKIFTFFVDISK